MKVNRFIALGTITLLVLGVMGVISMKAFAQDIQAAAQSQNCGTDQVDGAPEVQNSGADTGNVDQQCGDQNALDTRPETTGTDEGVSSNGAEAASSGTPAVTADGAQKTAEAYLNIGLASKVELDDESGKLVYSISFSNGTDVKVDAMTGSILGIETGQN